ncbi:IS110 family transposase [Streptomyces sp. NPDC050564]|uniref:IS110 family transposase n=1 Tax=Streptomyces sp. NPDC050564 TaxID=3365631 RepID=UPI00378D21B1
MVHATCGIDWAEDHHDVAVVDSDGRLLGKLRISDDAAGFQNLLHLLTEYRDSPDDPIPVAIETSRGLPVAGLRASGRRVHAINPMAVARYRDRHVVSRKKSDHQDTVVLANILRTHAALHRPLPSDSDLVKAIAVLARAQLNAVWDRTRAHNRLRSHLREYCPAILEAFTDKRERLLARDARAILAIAPTPAQDARLTRTRPRNAVTQAPDANARSKPRPTGFLRYSTGPGSASLPRSSKQWDGRRSLRGNSVTRGFTAFRGWAP